MDWLMAPGVPQGHARGMGSFDYDRFKVQVKMALSRIANLQLKHANTTSLRRKEVAESLRNGQDEKARLQVKYLIRDDYTAEVYDMLQIICDELLRSAMLISQEKKCDESLAPIVKSLIYAAGRVDIPELLRIREQLLAKYGKEWVELANTGADPKLVLKLGIRNPDQMLVNRYLSAIAESFSIPWAPLEEDVLIDMHSPTATPGIPSLVPTTVPADYPPPPSYHSAIQKPTSPLAPQHRASTPDLPSVPVNRAPSTSPVSSGLPDFDELARRFEALKSNKPKT